ncbi:MAG: hypothetical protein MJK04_23455 [Psychrosphaera sp.]|nr:hypothetical protein [Psychrosphaera sp.]
MPIERRNKIIRELQMAVDQLTSPQEYALGGFSQCGGVMAFSRESEIGHLAEVHLNGESVTIEDETEVINEKQIRVRSERH